MSKIAQYKMQMKRENTSNVTIYGDNNNKDNYYEGHVRNINDNNPLNDDDIDNYDDDDDDDDNTNKNDEEDDNNNDEDNDNYNDDNNNENDANDNDNDVNVGETMINPHTLHKMKNLQAFFNEEAMDYVCDGQSHRNATETKDNDVAESISGSTALNH